MKIHIKKRVILISVIDFLFKLLKAFCVGGAICLVGQAFLNRTSLPPAKILVGFVVFGVVLGAVGLYAPLVEFAGAGASVPLTGFGFLLQKGVFDAVRSSGPIGILTGALTSGAAGISFAVLMGFLVALIFNPKKK